MPDRTIPPDLSALVLDCDGLLLDTEPGWTEAMATVFSRRGRVMTPEQRLSTVGGHRTGELLALYLDEPGRAADLERELVEEAVRVLPAHATLQPGAAELLVRARGGVRVGLASNTNRPLLCTLLEAADCIGWFEHVVSSSDVPRGKPHPDVYLRACELLEVDPAAAAAVEDSHVGAAAARAAGMFVVMIPSPGESTEHADLVLGRLDDPPLLGLFP